MCDGENGIIMALDESCGDHVLDHCWGHSGRPVAYGAGMPIAAYKTDLEQLVSEDVIYHEGSGTSVFLVDKEEDFVAVFQTGFPDEDGWRHEAVKGTASIKIMNIQSGTEMAFLFRKKGLCHVDAHLSDRVFIYEGNFPEGREEELAKYRNVIEHLERVEKGYAFYLNRGCSLPEAEAFMKYQEDVLQLLQEVDVFVSKSSGLYITWGHCMSG